MVNVAIGIVQKEDKNCRQSDQQKVETSSSSRNIVPGGYQLNGHHCNTDKEDRSKQSNSQICFITGRILQILQQKKDRAYYRGCNQHSPTIKKSQGKLIVLDWQFHFE